MAKGKGGKKVTSGGPHKKHGPKKHLFRWTGPMKWKWGQMGMLKKENDFDSFVLACQARGFRNPTKQDFIAYSCLPEKEKKRYFKSLSK